MVLAGIHQRETIAKAVNKAVRDAVKEAVKEAVKKTREEVLDEERRAVAVWYKRQQAAQREGRPFDEPPPGYVNGDAGGSSPTG